MRPIVTANLSIARAFPIAKRPLPCNRIAARVGVFELVFLYKEHPINHVESPKVNRNVSFAGLERIGK